MTQPLYDVEFVATRFINRAPITITTTMHQSLPEDSPFLKRELIPYSRDHVAASSDKKYAIPRNHVSVSGVPIARCEVGDEYLDAPHIPGSKIRGLLRSAAAKIVIDQFSGGDKITYEEGIRLFRGGVAKMKVKKLKAGKNATEEEKEAIAAANRTQANKASKAKQQLVETSWEKMVSDPLVGLFGEWSDNPIGGRVRIGRASVAQATECIEACMLGAKTELAFDRTNDCVDFTDTDIEGDHANLKQIPYLLAIMAGTEFNHKMNLSRVSEAELGLFFLALQKFENEATDVGGRVGTDCGGDLKFEYNVRIVHPDGTIENRVWSEMRDEKNGIFAAATTAFGNVTMALPKAKDKVKPRIVLEEEITEAPEMVATNA